MINLNTCTILGRLVREPAIHNGHQGSCAIFMVATNRRWTDKAGNAQLEESFVPCKTFNGWAKAMEGLAKGTPVLVSGRLNCGKVTHEDTDYREFWLIGEVVQALPSLNRADYNGEQRGVPHTEPMPF